MPNYVPIGPVDGYTCTEAVKFQGKMTYQCIRKPDTPVPPQAANPPALEGFGPQGVQQGGAQQSAKAAGLNCKEEKNKSLPECKDKKPEEQKSADTPKGCRALVPKCGHRDEFRAEFYKTKRSCLYGGNISSYSTPTPQKNKCAKVRKSKANPAAEKECAEKGQIICNPLVFGYGKDKDGKYTEPICVDDGEEATEECDKKAPPDNVNQLFDQDWAGLKESWNAFVKDLKNICTEDQASAQFHCKECNVVYKRLFALNTKYRGNLCENAGDAKSEPPPKVTK
jgi:hypothetical protein